MTTFIAPEAEDARRTTYERDGWYQPDEKLDAGLVASLKRSVQRISAQQRPEVVYEQGTGIVRAIHGCHRYDDECAALVRHPALVGLAEALIGGSVYVYQFKVNLKQPRQGAAWPWHQDYAFWRHEDGMPAPEAVNIAVNLDDVHAGNGPLRMIPGSHRLGLLSAEPQHTRPSGDWRQHVSADLEYTVPSEVATGLAERDGEHVAVGPAGSVLAFHPSIVHSSSDNTSLDRRAVLLVTYNSVTNAPAHPHRPDFLVDRDTTPITARPTV